MVGKSTAFKAPGAGLVRKPRIDEQLRYRKKCLQKELEATLSMTSSIAKTELPKELSDDDDDQIEKDDTENVDVSHLPPEEVIKYNSRKRKEVRRSNLNYTTFHLLYTTPVSSEDYATGTYTGPIANCDFYGPAYLPFRPDRKEKPKSSKSIPSSSSVLPPKKQKVETATSTKVPEKSLPGPVGVKSKVPKETIALPKNLVADEVEAILEKVDTKAKRKSLESSKPKPGPLVLGEKKTKPANNEDIPGWAFFASRPIWAPSSKVSGTKRPLLNAAMAIDTTDLSSLPRGVTMRPSGKWQAQFYFHGRSRYIGVFDNARMAAGAYNIVHDRLLAIRSAGDFSNEQANKIFSEVRRAACAAVDDSGNPSQCSQEKK
jgi:hypothetical protein